MASRQLRPVCTVVISIRHNRQSLASMVPQKPLKIHTILWSNQCSAPQIVDNAHPHKAARNLNQTATARRSPVTLSRLVAVPELPFRTLSLPRPKRGCTRSGRAQSAVARTRLYCACATTSRSVSTGRASIGYHYPTPGTLNCRPTHTQKAHRSMRC